MKRAVTAVIALVILAPVADVVAAPTVISEPFTALQGADRIGNETSTAEPAPAPTPTTTTTTLPAHGVSGEMQEVLDLVNVERTSRGLVPMRFSVLLNQAALTHTQNQADDGDIYHTDPDDGSSPGVRISRTGYEFSTWGENVAAGYQTPASVMVGWMNSQGHCKNILNPGFTEIGVGYVSGGKHYDQFWTQAFARPRGVDRPPGTYNPAWC